MKVLNVNRKVQSSVTFLIRVLFQKENNLFHYNEHITRTSEGNIVDMEIEIETSGQ